MGKPIELLAKPAPSGLRTRFVLAIEGTRTRHLYGSNPEGEPGWTAEQVQDADDVIAALDVVLYQSSMSMVGRSVRVSITTKEATTIIDGLRSALVPRVIQTVADYMPLRVAARLRSFSGSAYDALAATLSELDATDAALREAEDMIKILKDELAVGGA